MVNRTKGIKKKISAAIFGSSKQDSEIKKILKEKSADFCKGRKARVLFLGCGFGSRFHKEVLNDDSFAIIATDIFKTPVVDEIVDAHDLPFDEHSFDIVVLESVLEHVIEPKRVIQECERVLVQKGLIYVVVPFMQQVHEGAYDFQRYTATGLRWLLANFEILRIGVAKGPGTAFLWSLRYLLSSFSRSKRIAAILVLPFFWIRLLDFFANTKQSFDSACEYYLVAEKSIETITRDEAIDFYPGDQ